jgi:hypothetical protein
MELLSAMLVQALLFVNEGPSFQVLVEVDGQRQL